MKCKYFIPDIWDNEVLYGVLIYIMLFIPIYLFIYLESNFKKFMIMVVISLTGLIIMANETILIINPKEECNYNVNDILLMRKGELEYFIIYSVGIIISSAALYSFSLNMALFTLAVIIISYVSITYIKHSHSRGLYINGKEMCYIFFFKKRYLNVDELAGIKIEKAQVYNKGHTYYLKDKDGGDLYCMLFLNKVEVGMNAEYYGSFDFGEKFPKRIIAETMYDAEVIGYLKHLNPNIIVMLDIR